MYLVQLDENNVVLSCHGDNSAPLLTPLDASFILAPGPVAVGHLFETDTKMFRIPPRHRWVTRLAFWNRMTQPERIGVDLASERPVQEVDELPADFEIRRSNAAALRDMRAQLDSATYIDLTRTDTREGVQTLEAMGLLGVGRAVDILDGSITDHEYFPDA